MASSPPPVPTHVRGLFDDFEIVARIGSGGMADVSRARHRRSGVEVALKVMAPRLLQRPHFRRAFREEVESTASRG